MACSADVQRACQVLSQRRLDECKLYGEPAYITVDGARPCGVMAKETEPAVHCLPPGLCEPEFYKPRSVSTGSESDIWEPSWDSRVFPSKRQVSPPCFAESESATLRLPPGLCEPDSFEPYAIPTSTDGGLWVPSMAPSPPVMQGRRAVGIARLKGIADCNWGQPPVEKGAPVRPGQLLGWEQPVRKSKGKAMLGQTVPTRRVERSGSAGFGAGGAPWRQEASWKARTMPAGSQQQQQQQQQQRPKRHCRLLIAESLRQLQGEDPRCVLYTCHINRLGFDSAELLREHFERFGPVRGVFLSNAHERCPGGPFPERLRPSRIGFVLMRRPDDAAAALAAGDLQTVRHQHISVRQFERHSSEADSRDGDEGACIKEEEAETSSSGASTRAASMVDEELEEA